MRVEYRVNDRLTVTAEGDKAHEIFEQLAKLQEAFGEECCGKCGGKELRFVHRVKDTFNFYELKCQTKGCYAKLEFGKGKDTFYPKRMVTDDKGKAVKDADGKGQYLPDNGWMKYNRDTKENE